MIVIQGDHDYDMEDGYKKAIIEINIEIAKNMLKETS